MGLHKGQTNSGSFKKGLIPWNNGLKGIHLSSNTEFQKGHIMNKEIRKKISQKMMGNQWGFQKGCIPLNKGKKLPSISGPNHWNWKEDDAKYSAIHMWVRKQLGRPERCENCGKDRLSGHKIHWANRNHSYKRNLMDWMRLCFQCHRKYDKENNLFHSNII